MLEQVGAGRDDERSVRGLVIAAGGACHRLAGVLSCHAQRPRGGTSEESTCTSSSGSSAWLRMYRYEKMTRQVLEFRWAVPRILGHPFPLPHCGVARSDGRS
jgi:hypothetical protein